MSTHFSNFLLGAIGLGGGLFSSGETAGFKTVNCSGYETNLQSCQFTKENIIQGCETASAVCQSNLPLSNRITLLRID